jgi:hypothetical protein
MNRTGLFILAGVLALPASDALAKGGRGHGHGGGNGHAKHAREADRDDRGRAESRAVWRNTTGGARRVRVAQRRGLDENGDGIVTRSEWRGNARSFSVLDRNGDGIISARDRIYSTRNYYGANARYGRWSTLDRNADGVLERWEWPHSGSLFDAIDRNNDGLVSQWELRDSVR